MATRLQRFKANIDSLADSDVGNAPLLKIADAFAFTYRRDETLTNDQKAGVYLQWLRQSIKQIVLDAETSQAAAAEIERVRPGAQVDIGADE